jgi:hypothetical protein
MGRKPGPNAKRSEERVRRNIDDGIQVSFGAMMPVEKLDFDLMGWDNRAVDFIKAATQSGQSAWYQQSDLQYLLLLGHYVDLIYKQIDKGQLPNGKTLDSIDRMMNALGYTEMHRRDMNIELKHVDTSEADNAAEAVQSYQELLERSAKEAPLVAAR